VHRSRLAGFIIDCQTDDLPAAAQFWSAALGLPPVAHQNPADSGQYVALSFSDMHIEVQKVDHPSRVHLDIEADDIEAEVRRLEKLGARRVAAVRTWVVMQAPTGQRFCIVRPQNANFAATSHVWDNS
jgi:predicted enzyme related to lactoylglutathione lyase